MADVIERVGVRGRVRRARPVTEQRLLKPLLGSQSLVDIVWCAPDPWDADPVRQAMVLSLVRSHGVRVLYFCPPDPVRRTRLGRRAAAVLMQPRPVDGTEHLWILERDTAPGRQIGPLGRTAQRKVLEAVWSIGLRRPVLLLEAPGLAGLAAATGWATVDRSSTSTGVPGSPASVLRLIETTLEERNRTRDRMPVLYVDHCALSSGAELALARMLPACHGLKPTVVLAVDGPLRTMLDERNIPVIVVPMNERARALPKESVVPGMPMVRAAWFAMGYTLKLTGMLRRSDAELVATNSLKSALYGGVAGRLAGVPVVWHLRDRISSDYLPAPVVTMVRLAARVLPSGIIANSEATLATLRLTSRARKRLTVQAIGSPCDMAVTSVTAIPEPSSTSATATPAPDPALAPPGVLGASSPVPGPVNVLTVGMVGRIAPWKGQDVFLKAFARAFDGGGARARIVGAALFGEDDFHDELKLLSIELGISDRVDFVGHSEDVRGEMSQFDVAVHASVVPEPFGQAVVEAMATGCAVVATNGGGPAEVVSDGVDGLLVPMGDATAMARQLRRLAADPALRARLGDAATVSARRFAPDLVAGEVESAYRLVVGRARHLRRFAR